MTGSHTVSMTPWSNGTIKTIQVVRDAKVVASQMHHKGTGHLQGIFINKEAPASDISKDVEDMQLEFTCLMQNARTNEGYAEHRRLKFWFNEGTDHSQRLTDSYDFFKELVNQDSFPKEYVGFIKRMLKQLQSDCYPHLRRVDLDIVPLTPTSQEAFVPEMEEKPLEVLVRECILKTLEDAYPNVLSVDDLVRITNIDDTVLLRLQLEELQLSDVIQPVCSEGSPIKKMGYRRKVQLHHKVEVIGGADKMKSISDERKPTVAIITNLLCEKLAVDSLIDRKTTYVRYKTEGDSNVYTIGYIGDLQVISVKLPMVGRELQAKISSGSITTRLLGAFQSIRHVILVGVGGGVPRIYEYENHSRLGDIVISAPADYYKSKEGDTVDRQSGHQDGSGLESTHRDRKAEPWYVYCDQASELQLHSPSEQRAEIAAPVVFKHQNFAPKDALLLEVAKQLVEAFRKSPKYACVWQFFIEEGLAAMNETEFDFRRPSADTDKLKLQIGEDVTVDVKHPEPPHQCTWPEGLVVPHVRLGCIGSGRPVTDAYQLRELFAADQCLLAYDAEFDQVLESLIGNGVASFLVVRGISDYVEGRQKSIWQPYASLAAAAFTKGLLLRLQSCSSLPLNVCLDTDHM